MISRSSIDEILERASLAEIVGEGVALKRQGSSLVGLCPFHSEKSPSFHIRDDRFYHCFGCGVSGNAISYVMRARGLGFPEAVEELAARLGIRIQYEGKAARPESGPDKSALYKVNALAAAFFRSQFRGKDVSRDALAAQSYVESRRVSAEAEQTFAIGFAPRERDALRQYLLKHKVPDGLMLQAGLVRRSDRGDFYDTFRARVMFPIFSDTKHIAGFGGRIIPTLVDEGVLTKAPKYLNSSDTPVYHKQEIFFGLPQALNAIRDSKEVYLVEGYLDVVGLWQVGVQNVLATCGTAVTFKHLRRLKHLTRRVMLLFDGDSAGRGAAGKSYPIFLNSGLDVSAVFLPSDEDPDTFAIAHGDATATALKTLPRVPLIDCFIDYLVGKTGVVSAAELGSAARGRLCEELAPILREVKNAIEQSEVVQRAALKLGVDAELLSSIVRDAASRGAARSGSESGKPGAGLVAGADSSSGAQRSAPLSGTQAGLALKTPERIPPIEELPRLDKELLHALMARKEDLPLALLHDPDLCGGVHPATFRFAQAMVTILGDSQRSQDEKKEDIKALLDEYGESWRAHWKASYGMLDDRDISIDKLFQECRTAFRRQQMNTELEQLERRARLAATETERMEISTQAVALKRQMALR